MKLNHVPLLRLQRELLDLPRGPRRFRRDIDLITGGGNELLLRLAYVNPMARAHVAEALDALLVMDADFWSPSPACTEMPPRSTSATRPSACHQARASRSPSLPQSTRGSLGEGSVSSSAAGRMA